MNPMRDCLPEGAQSDPDSRLQHSFYLFPDKLPQNRRVGVESNLGRVSKEAGLRYSTNSRVSEFVQVFLRIGGLLDTVVASEFADEQCELFLHYPSI